MQLLENQMPKKPGRRKDLRCDLLLEEEVTGSVFVTDVRVTHPDRTDAATREKALAAAESNWKWKFEKYSRTYDASASVFQPLVFEVYGGWAERTYSFLWAQMQAVASGDAQLLSRVWKDLRDRIAVALARGQAELIQHYNFRNGTLVEGELL